MEYPKINSLYKRQGYGPYDEMKRRYVSDLEMKPRKGKLIMGEYACEEFGSISKWTVTEKVDGTNVRIIFDRNDAGRVSLRGRTDDAQFPSVLLDYIYDTFTSEKMDSVFFESNKVVLFGEGYGSKIQSGGYYRSDSSFILFDALIDDWWLKRDSIAVVAKQLGIDHCKLLRRQNEDYYWSIDQIVSYIQSKPNSILAEKQHIMEGIVARSEPQMLFRKPPIVCDDPLAFASYHVPIMFKLKCKDFE